jgi:hypothetical protein
VFTRFARKSARLNPKIRLDVQELKAYCPEAREQRADVNTVVTVAEKAINGYLNPQTVPGARMPPPGSAPIDVIQKKKITEYLIQFLDPAKRQKYINMAENL